MKQLIVKADGTPMKSKVHAINFLKEKGLPQDCLIEENGQFFYEGVNEEGVNEVSSLDEQTTPPNVKGVNEISSPDGQAAPPDVNRGNEREEVKSLDWSTPVYLADGKTNTPLKIKEADVTVLLKAKHPAGQTLKRPFNAMEIKIDSETFIISLELCKKLFELA